MYVCMYVCIYISMNLIYIYIYICMYVCTVCTYIHIHPYQGARMRCDVLLNLMTTFIEDPKDERKILANPLKTYLSLYSGKRDLL